MVELSELGSDFDRHLWAQAAPVDPSGQGPRDGEADNDYGEREQRGHSHFLRARRNVRAIPLSACSSDPYGRSRFSHCGGNLPGMLLDSVFDRLAYPLAKLVALDCPLPRISLHLRSRVKVRSTLLPTARDGLRFTFNLPRGRRIA